MPIDFSSLFQNNTTPKIVAELPSQPSGGGGIDSMLSGLSELVSGIRGKPKTEASVQGPNLAPETTSVGTPYQGLGPSPESSPAGPVFGLKEGASQALKANGLIPNAHPELGATMAGIFGVETGGAKNPYALISKPSKNGDKAYGKYQIMGRNIPSWSREALGRPVSIQEYMANPELQEKIAAYHINKHLVKGHSPQDAASIWFTGRPYAKAGGKVKDIYGTTNDMYQKRFNQGYLKAREMLKGTTNQASPAPAIEPISMNNIRPQANPEQGTWNTPPSNMPVLKPNQLPGGSMMPPPEEVGPLQPIRTASGIDFSQLLKPFRA